MRGLQLIPPDTKIAFMAMHKVNFAISAFMIVGSIVLVAIFGLNFGIDFKGGILLDVRADAPIDMVSMRERLNALNLGEVGLQEFGGNDTVLIRLQRQEGGEGAQQAAIAEIRASAGAGPRLPPGRGGRASGQPGTAARRRLRAGRGPAGDHGLRLVPLRVAVRRGGGHRRTPRPDLDHRAVRSARSRVQPDHGGGAADPGRLLDQRHRRRLRPDQGEPAQIQDHVVARPARSVGQPDLVADDHDQRHHPAGGRWRCSCSAARCCVASAWR